MTYKPSFTFLFEIYYHLSRITIISNLATNLKCWCFHCKTCLYNWNYLNYMYFLFRGNRDEPLWNKNKRYIDLHISWCYKLWSRKGIATLTKEICINMGIFDEWWCYYWAMPIDIGHFYQYVYCSTKHIPCIQILLRYICMIFFIFLTIFL